MVKQEERRGESLESPHRLMKGNWLKKVSDKMENGIISALREYAPDILENEELLSHILHGGWSGIEQELSDTFNQTSEDVLTGCYDRRMFFAIIEKIILPRMRRLMSPDGTYPPFGYIAMLDIDKFKNINSMFSHKGGDVVLSQFGLAIKHHFREDDVIGRLGGDEFTVVAPGIGEADMNARMEALRVHFQNEPIRLQRVDTHGYGTVHLCFTYQVASLSDPDAFQDRLHAADSDVMRRKARRDAAAERRIPR
jgi:diguanylate cyclase (GGDEF)-like protein